MPTTVALPDKLVERLGRLAIPFVDRSPLDVITRLASSEQSYSKERVNGSPDAKRERVVVDRFPRQRGIRVAIGGENVFAHSVKDLYDQALRIIDRKGKTNALRDILPIRTSSKRYLAAAESKHPNGKPFFVPLQHGSIHMETHKSYETAVSHLAAMLARVGLSFASLD